MRGDVVVEPRPALSREIVPPRGNIDAVLQEDRFGGHREFVRNARGYECAAAPEPFGEDMGVVFVNAMICEPGDQPARSTADDGASRRSGRGRQKPACRNESAYARNGEHTEAG